MHPEAELIAQDTVILHLVDADEVMRKWKKEWWMKTRVIVGMSDEAPLQLFACRMQFIFSKWNYDEKYVASCK